jgi:hypothetical protein
MKLDFSEFLWDAYYKVRFSNKVPNEIYSTFYIVDVIGVNPKSYSNTTFD